MSLFKKVRFEYGITAMYLFIGGLWILFSDLLLELTISDDKKIHNFQTYKGWFYVVITGILFFFFIKRHLVKLRETEKRAKESDRLKSAFLENISHEIRTPMNGILGFSELLKSKDLTGEQKSEYIEIIGKSSERMLLLINDLIAISRLETGEIKVSYSKIDLTNLLDTLLSGFEPLAKEKGINLYLVKRPSNDLSTFYADREMLMAILSHLVKNAIKFTSQGEVTIGATIEESCARFFVKDSGIGIPKERLTHIFDRFVQADNVVKMAYEGLGIGLSIAKAYVEIMCGRIWVTSAEGEGSLFEFEIPLKDSI
ncbi:MAG: ATP-binding protein [Bacteroidales bacterium]|nr:ATP-binding protein [Bacteroidales bacterium]